MGQAITQVDAFTSKPFAGNPAAVCLLPDERDASWMQMVAREMNLSETAFLVKRGRGYDLRWLRSICAATRPWPALTCCGSRVIWARTRPRFSRPAPES
jgi:PhzF family phenazine biosynthesis protein